LANPKRTTEQFKEDVYKKHNNKVEILSEYIGATSPIDILYHCEKHGDTYKTINAKNIFGKQFNPCKHCDLEKKSISGNNKPKTKKELYQRLKVYCESKGGTLITKEWTTAKDLYEINCGNIEHPNFFSSSDSLIGKNQWCPYCCGRKGDFDNKYKQIIESNNGKMLSSYINGDTHIKVQCNKDNYIWDIYPSNLIKGRWCPVCSLPYSEKVPYDYLINNNYIIRVQYGFDDLIGEENELLRYDFAVFTSSNNLLGLIEIDDNEHRYNHKQLRRIKARERDKLKNQYCIKNNINLIRVPYNEYNRELRNYDNYYNYIHNHLKDFLNKIQQTTA
jgi:hypothetical protein